MWIPPLGQEDLLEEEMATRSSVPAWNIQWTEEPGGAAVYAVTENWTQLSN